MVNGSAKSGTRPKVVLVATGGTIVNRPDPATGALVPVQTGEELLASLPETVAMAEIEVVQFANVKSTNITPEDWLRLSRLVAGLLAAPEIAGVVVTHGTSTLEESAFFLDLTLAGDKPVVFTGSMRTAADRGFDGLRNLADAVRVAAATEAAGHGVLVVLNGRINAAREAAKTHKSNVETFQSGEYGYLGSVDPDRVVFYRRTLRRRHFPLPERLPRVDPLWLYSGGDDRYLRFAVDSGAAGIVLAGFGLAEASDPAVAGIRYALEKGVPVVIASRVPEGRSFPLYGGKSGGFTLGRMGCLFADDLSPWKARILLMLALAAGVERRDLQACFDA